VRWARSKFGGIVAFLQANELLLDGLQFDCEFVGGSEHGALGCFVLKGGHCGMDFHHLQGDGFAGFLDLLDGFFAGHAV